MCKHSRTGEPEHKSGKFVIGQYEPKPYQFRAGQPKHSFSHSHRKFPESGTGQQGGISCAAAMAPFVAAFSSLTALTFIIPAGESFHILRITQAEMHVSTRQTRCDGITAVCSARHPPSCPFSVPTTSLVGARCSARQRGALSVGFLAARESSYGDHAGGPVTGAEIDGQAGDADMQACQTNTECK